MISPSHSKLRRRKWGFSLTEVAIAMATVSVSLVSLLGLVSVTLQTGKTSASETSMTTASHQALDILRARSFIELRPKPADLDPSTLPTVYIAEDGQWLAPDRTRWPIDREEVPVPAEAVYKCVVTLEPDVPSLTPEVHGQKLSSTDTRVNLLRVQLSLLPMVSPSNVKPAVQIHATIPRP